MTILIMVADIPEMITIFRFVRKAARMSKQMKNEYAQRRTLRARIRRFYFIFLCYAALAMYAGWKLYMAVFVCEQGVWNIPRSFDSNGCVPLNITEMQMEPTNLTCH